MGLEKINDKAKGLLLLLLIILALFYLKPSVPRSVFPDLPCPELMFVQIEGDVQKPGVYPFCSPPTLKELIQRAGGLRRGNIVLNTMMDRSIASGARVILTYDGKEYKVSQLEMSAFHKIALRIPVSLNRESEEGLSAIPGIGPRLATSIVQERTERGGFKDLEDLKHVPGIGQKLYIKIKPYLSL